MFTTDWEPHLWRHLVSLFPNVEEFFDLYLGHFQRDSSCNGIPTLETLLPQLHGLWIITQDPFSSTPQELPVEYICQYLVFRKDYGDTLPRVRIVSPKPDEGKDVQTTLARIIREISPLTEVSNIMYDAKLMDREADSYW